MVKIEPGQPGFFWTEEEHSLFWRELGIAFCLMLVIEGIMPFLYPGRWRSAVRMLSQVDDRSMRIMGLTSMLVGTGLLYVIN